MFTATLFPLLALLVLLIRACSTSSSKATATCQALQEELGSVVQTYGEDIYMAAMQNPFSLFSTVLHPACVVVPRTPLHVQVAMAAIFRDQVAYAVQSGGHSAMTGWNTVQDGVLIFFGEMKNITYDEETNRAAFEPGVRWDEVLAFLEPFGVAAMGGRLGNIGTGLLLGGGISYLSNEYGWSCDAITEMDVVLVTGEMVTATAINEHSDLFRALKGGGSRFGIVTRYQVEPIPVGRSTNKNWYGGVILYPESSAEAVLRAVHHFVETNIDPKATLLSVLAYIMQDGIPIPHHTVVFIYRGSTLPREVFGTFLDIPCVLQDLHEMSYIEAASIFGSGDYRGSGERFSGTSFADGVEQYLRAYRDWRQFALESAVYLNSTVFALTPILEHQIQVARNKGGNAVDPALKPYASAHWHTTFLAGQLYPPAKVELGLQWLMRRNPPSPGAPLDINESDATQNVYATYGDYEFLKDVYRRYDPSRFNVRYSQGPIGL